ncbi:MAG: hypothetical protein AB1758_17900 [Candidatus Eremiobacterota bacterium]
MERSRKNIREAIAAMWSASELVTYFQPVDHPLQTLRDNPAAVDCPRFTLHSFIPGDDRILLNFEVYELPGERTRTRKISLGAAVTAGALLAGALIKRRPDMFVRAIYAGCAGGVAVMELCTRMGDRLSRFVSGRRARWLAWSIGSQDMVFTFGEQQIHLTLPTVVQVTVRSIHEGEGHARGSVYSVQLDLEDGRILPLYPYASSEAALGMARQVGRSLHVPMCIQPIELHDASGQGSLHIGPTLVEPGLN